MVPKRIMVIAGEASGDMLAAELVKELRARLEERPTYSHDFQPLHADLAPRFFGAGGPRMAEAGVELAFDMTAHAIMGLPGFKHLLKLRELFKQLFRIALERQPDAIICVDFSEFNHRFAHAIKQYVRARRGPFFDWEPKLIKYVSPQVWASREGRAARVAEDFDLLLSIIPFEKDWYAARVPKLRVEFVGHPVLDRYPHAESGIRGAELSDTPNKSIALLPGSRKGELNRHVPLMVDAVKLIRAAVPATEATFVQPTAELAQIVRELARDDLKIQVGGLADALRTATVAIACSGTVTMECAFFGVPTVTLYKTSWINFQFAKRLAKVRWITMPNLLANQEVFPEFIQHAATPENISRATLELLRDESRREQVKATLANIMASLGGPGAAQRAAQAIADIL
jgi:lipid-A-disaccharide synthase